MTSFDLEIQVSPEGSGHGAGTRTDPIDTIANALTVVRGRRSAGESAAIRLAPGRHRVEQPITLGSGDSGLTIIGDADHRSVIDGGVSLTQWTEATTENGVPVWACAAPAIRPIRSLFVDGERRDRPRYPRDGFLQIADQPGLDLGRSMVEVLFSGSDTFTVDPGDLRTWHDIEGLEAVVPHYWVEERMPITSIDTETGIVRSSRRSIFALRDDVRETFAHFWLDNVVEALGERPGEWYHDRRAGRILYAPRAGEDRAAFAAVVPLVEQLVVVAGDDRDAVDVSLRQVTLAHTDWAPPRRHAYGVPEEPSSEVAYASAPQASTDVTATIEVRRTRGFQLVDCVVEHVGGYAVELADGVTNARVEGNTLHDLGAGGVSINGASRLGEPGVTRDNAITDNNINRGGRVFPAGVGVLLRHSLGNEVRHNEIHDLYYSGISCGWVWGYADSISRDNHLEDNHIYDIGHGRLSDMGGIYMLGVQPGTTLRRNLIHGIRCANYGGWCIYLDEGTSHVVVEDNVCHDASTQAFHQHYGRENVVRNNVFAFGARGQVTIGRVEEHLAFTLERNIIIGDGRPAYVGRGSGPGQFNMLCDLNLVWDVNETPAYAGIGRTDAVDPGAAIAELPDTEWQGHGHDLHSVIADPELELPLPTAPAVVHPRATAASALGIHAIDLTGVGPRPRPQSGDGRPW